MAQVLRLMPKVNDPNVLVELSTADDAAVYRITEEIAVVLTADFFTPIVDDPYDFGRIAVTNALSDVYAMGARPVAALNLVAYPGRTRSLDQLEQILKGGADQACAAGVSILGGHSIDDPEPKYGLAVMGLANPGEIITNSAATPGNHLILTKPLGTGIISTAIKKQVAPPQVVARAVQVMTTLNGPAAEVMKRFRCRACTDVTGFGLMGHLHEMLTASKVGAVVYANKVPVINGVRELLDLDMAPGGTEANLEYLTGSEAVIWDENVPNHYRLLLCDAQTSGGLLIAAEANQAEELIDQLHEAGAVEAADIGIVTEDSNCRIRVSFS